MVSKAFVPILVHVEQSTGVIRSLLEQAAAVPVLEQVTARFAVQSDCASMRLQILWKECWQIKFGLNQARWTADHCKGMLRLQLQPPSSDLWPS